MLKPVVDEKGSERRRLGGDVDILGETDQVEKRHFPGGPGGGGKH